MKLMFIGVGSAGSLKNYQSNALLIDDTKSLLIDCGGDVRLALNEFGYTFRDINAVYISHMHQDHVGGLEWLAQSTYFSRISKPHMYINKYLKTPIWNTLKEGLSTLEGVCAEMDTFFYVHAISPNKSFQWNNISFQMIQTVHVVNGFHLMPSFGLFFEINGKKIYYTTDTQWAPNQIMCFYKKADIIFQDCEISPFKSGVHAHFSELCTLPEDIRGKMWLYHYPDFPFPDIEPFGFLGFVQQGQVFNF